MGMEDEELAYALHFNFKVINNKVEYEALLARLGLAILVGA